MTAPEFLGKYEQDSIRYFSRYELECRCCKGLGGMFNDGFVNLFTRSLDQLREKFGAPLRINSGYRCKAYNSLIGGSPTSKHMQGRAVDINTMNMSAADKYRLVKCAIDVGFNGVGIYRTFIHLDIRQFPNSLWFGE